MKDKFSLSPDKTDLSFFVTAILYYIYNSFMENYNFIPVGDALLLTGVYTGASIMFSLLCWLLYRNYSKANLVAFCIKPLIFLWKCTWCVEKYFPNRLLPNIYSSCRLHWFYLLFYWLLLRKRKRPLLKLTNYLNVLLIILLLADTVLLTGKIINKKSNSYSLPAGFKACESCPTWYLLYPCWWVCW